ncbi:phage gp6-like head-tail connector protein [Rhizobium laguerreae]|uniref:head-tail connector protein n=1 Tax=Rhizobium laguerreae TaxID=1076926 RepID=UPI001C91A22E|nr:head-tail connector protein [Rhizobium laguerreae]MBY3070749.1 phage gp6-like head-tail connector protein [Rhizobium laguerreae]
MTIVTLSLLKAHLSTDDLLDGNALGDLASGTDELLQHYLKAAEAWASGYLGLPLSDFEPDVPGDIEQAILQMAAHLYQNREAALVGVNAYDLPFGIVDFLRKYRREVTGRAPE